MVGKKYKCEFGNDANFKMLSLFYSFKTYICQDPKISRVYTAYNVEKGTLLACLARPLSAFTSRSETDTTGGGAWSRPPKMALERSCLNEISSSANRILRPRQKKLLNEFPKEIMIVYVLTCPTRPLPSLRLSCLSFDRIQAPTSFKTPPSPHWLFDLQYSLETKCISFHSCQILSPSETEFIVSAHRRPTITLLTLIA